MELVFNEDEFVGAFTSRLELLRAMVRRIGYDDDIVVRFFGTNACSDSWLLNDEVIDAIDEHNDSYGSDTINKVSPLFDTYYEDIPTMEFLMGQDYLHAARLIPNYFAPDGFHTEPITVHECYNGPRLDDDDMNFVYIGLLRGDLNDRLRFLAFAGIRKPIEGNVICRVWRMITL